MNVQAWSLTLRNFFIILAKNAVSAIVANVALMAMFSNVFTIHTAAGWIAMAKAAGAVVLGREVALLLPIIVKWSNTNNTFPSGSTLMAMPTANVAAAQQDLGAQKVTVVKAT